MLFLCKNIRFRAGEVFIENVKNSWITNAEPDRHGFIINTVCCCIIRDMKGRVLIFEGVFSKERHTNKYW